MTSIIPTAVPNITELEGQYVQECIDSTFVSSVGPFVDQFEDELAALNGCTKAAVVCSGTVALKMALEGLGIGSGDLVMIPALTFIATANSVSHTGADVWCVDVEERYLTLDVDVCRQAIETLTEPAESGRRHKKSGKILKAIMPVMMMGNSIDIASYVALAKEYGLKVVVDAAAAIGSTLSDKKGLAQTGVDAICFSFNGNKTITCGGGGAVVSADSNLIDQIKHLTSTGRVGRDYDHDVIAYNYRMTNIQAALGVAQLNRLPEFLKRKQEIHMAYREFSEGHEFLKPMPEPPFGTNTHWFSGLVYTGTNTQECDAFRSFMNDNGVDLRKFWKPIPLQKPYEMAYATDYSVTKNMWQKIFPLLVQVICQQVIWTKCLVC